MAISAPSLSRTGASRALFAGVFAVLCSGSLLPLGGLLVGPLHARFGWSAGATGAALGVSMALYGLTAPFSAALMERYGMRPVALVALLCSATGAVLTATVVRELWQFLVCWGVLVGLGCGGLSMAFAATLAGRWFRARRGLVTGVLTAASVLGQFGLLPLVSRVVEGPGWQVALLGLGGLCLLAALVVLVLLREPPGVPQRAPLPAAGALPVLVRSSRTGTFWLLAGVFAVCGASTNGVMWTHFTPAAHDHGLPVTAASSLLALVGLCNVVGTLGSGRLTDRHDPRRLLGVFFAARALLLCLLPLLLGDRVGVGLLGFAVLFGALDVATVPPVVALCRARFGARGPVVFGWVNGAHQLGAALFAWAGGPPREVLGSYDPVWVTVGGLCAGAALLVLLPHPARTSAPAGASSSTASTRSRTNEFASCEQ